MSAKEFAIKNKGRQIKIKQWETIAILVGYSNNANYIFAFNGNNLINNSKCILSIANSESEYKQVNGDKETYFVETSILNFVRNNSYMWYVNDVIVLNDFNKNEIEDLIKKLEL